MNILTPDEYATWDAETRKATLEAAVHALEVEGGALTSRAAKLLGLPRRTAYSWMANPSLIPYSAMALLDAMVALKRRDQVTEALEEADKALQRARTTMRQILRESRSQA